jgi:hypothetical protein
VIVSTFDNVSEFVPAANVSVSLPPARSALAPVWTAENVTASSLPLPVSVSMLLNV